MNSSTTYTLESFVMTYEQLASFEPALARFLDKMRPCFKRDKTFGYLQKYVVGLMTDLKRKSIEPIALASGVAVRTLQEFLAFFAWDHEQADQTLVRELVNRQHGKRSIGVLDASAYAKGLQRTNYCNLSQRSVSSRHDDRSCDSGEVPRAGRAPGRAYTSRLGRDRGQLDWIRWHFLSGTRYGDFAACDSGGSPSPWNGLQPPGQQQDD